MTRTNNDAAAIRWTSSGYLHGASDAVANKLPKQRGNVRSTGSRTDHRIQKRSATNSSKCSCRETAQRTNVGIFGNFRAC